MSGIRSSLLICMLLLASGSLLAQAGANDPTFNPGDIGFGYGDGANGPVSVTCMQPDGKILIGGQFTKYNGTGRRGLARLNSDGTLDNTFASPSLVNPPNDDPQVRSIILQPDGKIIIGGAFEYYNYNNGISKKNLMRLNANGTIDLSFTGSWMWGTITCMIQQADGKVVIGGFFNAAAAGNRYITRLSPEGILDTTFNTNGIGANSLLFAMATQADGKILIGGMFTSYNNTARSRIARLDADGNLDPGFHPVADEYVQSIALQGEHEIVLGGRFTTINGLSANRIARIDSSGVLDSDFAGIEAGSVVNHVTVQPDGKVILLGSFSSVDGVERYNVARLNIDGTLDPLFGMGMGAGFGPGSHASVQPDGKIIICGTQGFSYYDFNNFGSICRLNPDGIYDVTFNPGSGATLAPTDIAIQTDNKIILAGPFTRINGVTRYHLARLNADGDLDTGFDAGILRDDGLGGSAKRVVIQPDGKILFTGSFNSVDGIPRSQIARVHPDGALDTTFNAGQIASYIQSLALQDDGKILICGNLDTIGGLHYGVMRLLSDGAVDNGFDPGAGVGVRAEAIVVQPDGKILICGHFNTIQGIPRNRIARLNADGSLDTTFDPGSGPQPTGPGIHYLYDMVLHADGKITFVGIFDSYAGVNRENIARIHADGSLDTTYAPGEWLGAWSQSIMLGPDGSSSYVAAGGGVVHILSDGHKDLSFASGGANGGVSCMAMQSDNKLVVGGYFTSYSGVGRNRIARVLNDFSTEIQFEEGSQVTIFPNPTFGSFTLTSTITGPMEVTVTNLTGQLVWEERMRCDTGRNCTIDLGNTAPGVYVINARGEGKTSTARVMVQ